MPRWTRFIVALVASLALLTVGAAVVVRKTTRAWFERDTALRADLVFSGARGSLAERWRRNERKGVREFLSELTRDERLLAAEACTTEAGTFAVTDDFPAALSCKEIVPRVHVGTTAWEPWRSIETIPGGEVQISALPISDDAGALGVVVFVHDLSFVARRERSLELFLIAAFGVLAVLASVTTVVAARISWRSWRDELRRFVRGETERPSFQPLMQDVRDLVERISEEKEGDEGGAWTPQRLRQTLHRHLHGERVIIVANREPYIHQHGDDNAIRVIHPASGLVTALEPVMRACSGVWVGHGSGSADRETADEHARIRVPPGEESYSLRRVWLTREQEQGYYYGFSNEGLWPLCHIAHTKPIFRSEDWKAYQEVNAIFADAIVEEIDVPDPVILVQDYHFALLPRLLRERIPRATIIAFWHIPWPNAERFGICPWRTELLEGLLGATVVGFHTQSHCLNFLESCERYLEARVDREQSAVIQHARTTLVRPYPISIDWPNRWAKGAPSISDCRAGVLAELGLKSGALLAVGVDRLDYTKGVEERLLATERLLERHPEYRGRFTFVQLAAPSRTEIARYRELNDAVEALAARINARFATDDWKPIVLRRSHHEPPDVFRYYRAADACYVSSLHDGMNLVAKEFVAARDDERGVLVLSSFTGAARELTEALIVNPYDIDEAADALAAAVSMPIEEQRDRMRALRAFVGEFNVYRWAGRMLRDAARIRRRERLLGRFDRPDESRLLRPKLSGV